MFVHHVFFWMKEDLSSADLELFEKGVSSLCKIDSVKFGDIGKPAGTNRPVIERSYGYSLLLAFENESAHDEYQTHPVHLKFIEECSMLWSKVIIYDSDTIL